MNTQKQKNSNKQGIRFSFKLGLAIIFMVLACITGCNKDDDSNGKLEIIGKRSYPLDNALCYIFTFQDHIPTYDASFYFVSSEDSVQMEISLSDIDECGIPTGTFLFGVLERRRFRFSSFSSTDIHTICEGKTVLKIKKSGNNYNVTLTGKIRFIEDPNRVEYNYKLTYRGFISIEHRVF